MLYCQQCFKIIFAKCLVFSGLSVLTHWGWVMHICIDNLAIIDSDNGLVPGWCQAIIWTNAGVLLIGPLGTNFSEILIEIHTFSFKKMHLKMLSGKWRPFCLSLSVLKIVVIAPLHHSCYRIQMQINCLICIYNYIIQLRHKLQYKILHFIIFWWYLSIIYIDM